jgi:selT/selW/selH-like putative selenoprotein
MRIGYGPRYQRLVAAIKQQYPSGIEYSYEATPQATGFFEVTVNGTLVHSKKNGGGHVDTPVRTRLLRAANCASRGAAGVLGAVDCGADDARATARHRVYAC